MAARSFSFDRGGRSDGEAVVLISEEDLAVLEAAEDLLDVKAAREALAEMKAKGEKPIPWEIVKKELRHCNCRWEPRQWFDLQSRGLMARFGHQPTVPIQDKYEPVYRFDRRSPARELKPTPTWREPFRGWG